MLGWAPGTLAGQMLSSGLLWTVVSPTAAFIPERRAPEMASGLALTARRRDGTGVQVDVSLSPVAGGPAVPGEAS